MLSSHQALYDNAKAAYTQYPPHGEAAINRAAWLWAYPAQVSEVLCCHASCVDTQLATALHPHPEVKSKINMLIGVWVLWCSRSGGHRGGPDLLDPRARLRYPGPAEWH